MHLLMLSGAPKKRLVKSFSTAISLEIGKNHSAKISVSQVQHGRYLENWYLEAGRDLGASEADTEVGAL